MSDALSFAVVTATLQDIIQYVVGREIAGVTVRVGTPRAPAPGAGPEVNLYLYMVSPNISNRNDDLPTRSADGRLLQRPAVALDLHYVLSFYGEQQLSSERMAGRLASFFHAHPVLTPEQIRMAISANGSYAHLSASDLADAREPVRLTPYYATLEELSKLWTVFFQMAHRLSLQYVVGPVVVDEPLMPAPPPPVVSRRLSLSHLPWGRSKS